MQYFTKKCLKFVKTFQGLFAIIQIDIDIYLKNAELLESINSLIRKQMLRRLFMENIIIRSATAADYDTVIEIAVSQWAKIYEVYRQILGDEIYEMHFPNHLEAKAKAIRADLDSGKVLVAECEGQVAAFIHYNYCEQTKIGEISDNAVSGEFRGRGIAPQLYNHIIDMFRKLGAQGVTVHTGLDDGHAPARRAYEKVGFKVGLPSIRYYMNL